MRIEDNCILWRGKPGSSGGYAVKWIGGKLRVRAHRLFYEAATGEDLSGMVLHHKCGNKMCVNPWHMEPMSGVEHSRMHGFKSDDEPCITCGNVDWARTERARGRYCRTCSKERCKKRYRTHHVQLR